MNTKIRYYRDPPHKKNFSWKGEVIDGTGRKRFFDSAEFCWLSANCKIKKKKGPLLYPVYETTIIAPLCWTPYQLRVYEERRPNGNIICYAYTPWKDAKYYPMPALLKKITAYNSKKTKLLAELSFRYKQNKKGDVLGFSVIGSDKRRVLIDHNNSLYLSTVLSPGRPRMSYGYKQMLVNRIEKPDGRIITTECDEKGKVKSQSAPIGPNGEMLPIGRYFYYDNHTEVFDAENNKTIYRFNDKKQLLSIETYQEDLYRIDRFTWDAQGNLIKKSREDALGNPLLITEYTFDKNHNPIIEKTGVGNTSRTITRTFSSDGFNLKLSESDRPQKIIRYTYKPSTNLLTSEITYEDNQPKKRIFHFYNDIAVCIKTIVDDGTTEDPTDLQNVTYRRITSITPKTTHPCYGLPEIVEEKSLTQGQEILLHKTIYSYASSGKITKEEHYDATNTLTYTLLNDYHDEKLNSHIDPLGVKTNYQYDANYNLIFFSKEKECKKISYDKANRPIRIEEIADGIVLIREKKYDKLGRVIIEIDPCNQTTKYGYDALGRLITITYSDGSIHRKEYDLLDNVVREIDPEGYLTKKSYSCFGQVTSIEYPDSSSESFSYNSTGTLASHTDKNGALTLYTYDLFDHILKTEVCNNHLSKSKVATWTPFQKLSETEGSLTTLYTYDFAGRKIEEQKNYRKIIYTYDPLGRICSTQEGDIELIEEYDLKDQLIEKRRESKKKLQTKENYTYDKNENCIELINSQGVTRTECNSLHQPLLTIDALGFKKEYFYLYNDHFSKLIKDSKQRETLLHYDSRDREILSIKKNSSCQIIQQSENRYDKNSNRIEEIHSLFLGCLPLKTIIHLWEFGPMGRIESFFEGGVRKRSYSYDEKGRLKTLFKPNGAVIHHEYDGLGRLLRLFSKEFDYNYSYDQNDRILSVVDKVSNRETIRSYDPLGNILSETLVTGLSFQNRYDLLGRRVSSTLFDSSTIEYDYDGIYLYQVSRNGLKHTYFERNLEGEVVKAILATGEELSITRDPLGRPIRSSSPYYSADLKYDETGCLLHYGYQDLLGEEEEDFSYDDLDQLILEKDHIYQFDSLYNRIKKDDLDYTIDSFCQISCDGRDSYTYDDCGNLLRDGNFQYFYDSLDRLVAVERGTKRIEYGYDPFHRRISKTVFCRGKKEKEFWYLWDGNNEIGCVDEKGSIEELRILGEGLGAEIGAAILYELKGRAYQPIHDHLGSLVALIDLKTKEVVECNRYTAFGEEKRECNGYASFREESMSPWRFSSKRVDPETDLVFFGRRYYSPNLGRFITQDPEGFEDGPNLYAYLHNCPLSDVDPYGLFGIGSPWEAGRYLYDRGRMFFGSPYFQGSLQALGGMAEIGIGAGMTLSNCGAASLGWPVMAHGCDQFLSGVNTFRGMSSDTMTSQLFQKAGISPLTASLVDSGLSIASGIGLSAAFKGPQTFSSLGNFQQMGMQNVRFGETTSLGIGEVTSGKNFKSFTKRNCRYNLSELTGGIPAYKVDAHHVLTQRHGKFFFDKGMNIHDPKYLTWWERSSHRRTAKAYNDAWLEYIGGNREATPSQILENGRAMMKEYGIEVNY